MYRMETQPPTPPRGRQPAAGMNAEEIAAWLRAQVEEGIWAPGDALPTNADLIEQTGASNSTVSKAVAALKAEGLIYGRKGARPRVADRRIVDYRITDQTRPTWLIKAQPRDMFSTVAEARSAAKELTVAAVSASPGIAARLGIAPGEQVISRKVVQSISGRVIATEETHYPMPLAEELGLDSPEDIVEGTSRRVGNSRHRDTGWLTETTVRPATPEEQKLFAVAPGASLLEVMTTSANGHEANAVSIRVVHPAGVRIVHEIGDDSGLATIRTNRETL